MRRSRRPNRTAASTANRAIRRARQARRSRNLRSTRNLQSHTAWLSSAGPLRAQLLLMISVSVQGARFRLFSQGRPKIATAGLFYQCVEKSCLDPSGTSDLNKNAVKARLGKAVGDGNLRGNLIAWHLRHVHRPAAV